MKDISEKAVEVIEINVLIIHRSLADLRYVNTHLNLDILNEINSMNALLSKLKNKLDVN
ncbi:hypothetical protein [Lysinibacillus sp. 3P01SB]|uniref:hypothetical protein n=1 Tax=Lysinibacillus sp. 3P01SB TaxID=3132284 RepID=UPI0039A50B23